MIQPSGRVATTTTLTIESTINKQRKVEGPGGAYGETARQGRRTCTHNNQTDHAEGGVVGNDDDFDDGDNGNGNNNDDGGCGGRDGHHRMRKGRGHDDRTNTTIK